MKIASCVALTAVLAWGMGASAQEPAAEQVLGARIWLDRGDEPLLQRGDRVRVYYRTEADAFVAIFHVDTDGTVTLLHPRAPEEEAYTRAGRDYRLLFPQSSYWYVDEYPGKGYFFLVASPEPLALEGLDYVYPERRWDLTRVGQTIYRDPYLAMDDYVALLIPDWAYTPYGLDFLSYDVGEVHEYPRFLCYDCHGYRSYATWNPYTYACASFRVVVWNDPWFYPSYRYGGTRVVYAAPRRGVARFEFKERAAGEAWTPLIRTREATPRRAVDYVEPGAAQRGAAQRAGGSTPPTALPRRPSSVLDPGRATALPGASSRPSIQVDPSAGRAPSRQVAPSRQATPSASAPRGNEPARAVAPPTSGERPVLQRRPPATAPTRPSGGATTTRPRASGGGAAVSRPSSGGTRVVTPPRASSIRPPGGSRPATTVRPPSSGSRPPSSARPSPSVRPPSSGSRTPASVRPSSGGRPSSGSGSRAARPPPRRKPGGGGS